jgi:hypothetical protein
MAYVSTGGQSPTLCFGKFNGFRLNDPSVRKDYLEWVLKTLDLDTDEEIAVRHELRRRTGQTYNNYQTGTGSNTSARAGLPTGVTPQTIIELVAAGRQLLAKRHHPDVGGDLATMQRYNCTADYLEKMARALLVNS